MLTPAELEMRKSGIGGSEIGAVAGLSPWSFPIDVWERKTGRAPEFQGNWATELGEVVEPLIGKWYCAKVGATQLIKATTVQSKQHKVCVATPDYWVNVEGERLLEVKNVGWRVAQHWDEGPPDYVVAQVVWGQIATECEMSDVAVSLGSNEPSLFQVPHMPEVAASLLTIAEMFWEEHIKTDTPPDPDASNSYTDYLKRKFPGNNDEIVDAPKDAVMWYQLRNDSAKQIKELKATQSEAENHLRAMIGENDGIETDLWKVTYKNDKTGKRRFHFKDKTK